MVELNELKVPMPRYTEHQISQALIATKGMIYLAARHLGCSYNTIADRVNKSEPLRSLVEEQTGTVLDTAELKLFDAMESGDLGAIKYLLSTKGKARGYVERTESEHSGTVVIREYPGVDPDA